MKFAILGTITLMLFFLAIAPNLAGAFSVPANIVAYANLTFGTSWNVGHGAYVQQMVNVSESTFGANIVYNNNFANFEYFHTRPIIILCISA